MYSYNLLYFLLYKFYESENKLYVGELIFIPCGGFGKFEPEELVYKIGELLNLSKLNKEYVKTLHEFEN